MNKIVIANWKMNKTFNESAEWLTEFNRKYKKRCRDSRYRDATLSNEFGIAMPPINLAAHVGFNKVKQLMLVAQDVSAFPCGPYTGDVSAEMLSEFDIKYVIVGHSERRRYHYETCEDVNAKARAALEYGITPLICFGETLEEFEKGLSKEVVKKKIEDSSRGLDFSKVIISYEPIWAMGTGKCATPEFVHDMAVFIRSITSSDAKIIYGGSVNAENIVGLAKIHDINGFLIGNATLDLDTFLEVIAVE
ncbi:triose-phosphate isomerase [Mycoplasma sp. ES3157-GEN-MYC]|uniref:Triosephosphate isomerase n=1 Tax=Mycoplasma miroungigenitalium TaxID=754515 RepID=A0A6M4JAD6_9MOLU|nr:triose-phosphate isomerase [Mycoplasma miroungigenitalium]MBU4690110.1 triose-phosphate isomerase [Mycoplasma miroungigenitalium]MBU4691382.1 triose-phosphate isomerase [Mycoplasma miroungigenitalium]QJR43218.1 triose-phosphate isomerase [Mycoplasma miroungigenitalium]